MSKLIICRGLPGSGKTTWSKQYCLETGAVRVNRDDLRASMHGGLKWTKEREKAIKAARDSMIRGLLETGGTVISDDTNLDGPTFEHLSQVAALAGASVETKEFRDVPLALCMYRNGQRPKETRVPEEVILRMARKHGLPLSLKRELKPCIICDIDGTVAVNTGHRSFHEGGEKYWNDEPRALVISLVDALRIRREAPVIFLSGREGTDENREVTASWLVHYIGYKFTLVMRPEGDHRNDALMKRELYEKHILGKGYEPIAIFDDRQRVLRMWFELGFGDRIINVGPGYEF